MHIQLLLKRYSYVSGQAINTAKSSILFSANTPDDSKHRIANVFGVDITIPMGNYLGVPAEWGATKKQTFQYMLDRIAARAQSWQANFLTHAGRSVMIKSVLQALPTYLFSCFLLPKHILKRMDQVLINFWWSGNVSNAKLHWLPATDLRKPVSEGGLGFRSFYNFNLAFLAKLAWKVITTPDSLWSQLLKGLYFPHSSFLQAARHHKSSWIWSGIMEGRKALLCGLRKNIGDGNDTSVLDAWIPEAPQFKASCSATFASMKVSDFIINPQKVWNVEKLRAAFSHEVVKQILLIPLGPEGYPDKFIWHLESTGKFTVKSCYRYLRSVAEPQNQPVADSSKKLWKWLWHLKLPPKIQFFLWRVCRNALPTKLSLFRRNCGSTSFCVTCNAEEETVEHLLFHCAVSRSFWQLVAPAIQCPQVHDSISSWFTRIASSVSSITATEIGFTAWYIWKMRNEVIFQDISPSLLDLAIRRNSDLQRWTSSSRYSVQRSVSSSFSNPITNTLVPTAYSQKVVCDGAFNASIQKGAYGVVVYNSEGYVVNGRAGTLNCAAPICAEAKAICVAVDLVKSMPLRSLVLTDSLILSNALAGTEHDWPWQVSAILALISRLLFWNQQVQVCYSPRQTIQAAHKVAIQARDGTLMADWLSSL
ncbi:Putative ribonuclease H protein At1g65750 [Linum perenne]